MYLQISIRNVSFKKCHLKYNQNYKLPRNKSSEECIKSTLGKIIITFLKAIIEELSKEEKYHVHGQGNFSQNKTINVLLF